jgi:hypothetical protein
MSGRDHLVAEPCLGWNLRSERRPVRGVPLPIPDHGIRERIIPITTAGRIVGGITMVVGISTFAIVTAKIAEILARTPPTEP